MDVNPQEHFIAALIPSPFLVFFLLVIYLRNYFRCLLACPSTAAQIFLLLLFFFGSVAHNSVLCIFPSLLQLMAIVRLRCNFLVSKLFVWSRAFMAFLVNEGG